MEAESMSRAVRIRQGRQSCEKNLRKRCLMSGHGGRLSGTAEEAEADADRTAWYELTGRIVVAAGIFLLLFFGGRVLKEPSREMVQSWIAADPVYEKLVPEIAAWAEERLSENEKGN